MPSSAGAVIRKRKSNSMEGTPRKILAEINAGSGLPVPGWTKASTKKTPKMKPNKGKESKGRDIIQTLDLAVELPTETVEDLLSNIFGEVNSRIEKQANLLKRTKPEQKLFGYAKTFLDFETKRLAVGLKVSIPLKERYTQHVTLLFLGNVSPSRYLLPPVQRS